MKKTLLRLEGNAEINAFTAYISAKGFLEDPLSTEIHDYQYHSGYDTFVFQIDKCRIKLYDCPAYPSHDRKYNAFTILKFRDLETFLSTSEIDLVQDRIPSTKDCNNALDI